MLADLPVLKRGDRGDRVLALQDVLGRLGFGVVKDGVFGTETEQAVRSFQGKQNIVSDGVVGTNTLGRLQQAVSIGMNTGVPVVPSQLVNEAGMFSGITEKVSQPGVTGYPIWVEVVTVGVIVFTGLKLAEFNRK